MRMRLGERRCVRCELEEPVVRPGEMENRRFRKDQKQKCRSESCKKTGEKVEVVDEGKITKK